MSKRLTDRVQDRNCFTCYLGYKIERRGTQQLTKTLRHLSSRERKTVQEVEKTEHIIRNEDIKRGQDISDLSKYFRSNDFRRIEHGITLEEARREYFQGILGRSKLLTCGKTGCGLFPCNPIKSYHFMFRKVQSKCSIHHVDLSVNIPKTFGDNCYNRSNIPNNSHGSSESRQESKTNQVPSVSLLPDIKAYGEQISPHSQANLQTNNDNDTLTKKERFLKLAVHKKRLENERRIFIDRAANYGIRKTPWRKLLKPVKPSADDSVSGNRRFLTF